MIGIGVSRRTFPAQSNLAAALRHDVLPTLAGARIISEAAIVLRTVEQKRVINTLQPNVTTHQAKG
jgi:hypothetical protein